MHWKHLLHIAHCHLRLDCFFILSAQGWQTTAQNQIRPIIIQEFRDIFSVPKQKWSKSSKKMCWKTFYKESMWNSWIIQNENFVKNSQRNFQDLNTRSCKIIRTNNWIVFNEYTPTEEISEGVPGRLCKVIHEAILGKYIKGFQKESLEKKIFRNLLRNFWSNPWRKFSRNPWNNLWRKHPTMLEGALIF